MNVELNSVRKGGRGESPEPLSGRGLKTAGGTNDLTVLEVKIARLVNCAFTNAEIGRALGYGDDWIRQTLIKIYDKLGLSNRVELALWWEVHGKGRS
jgi:DNA-binding NarL/FixJ family response regulator